jgi:hypothetical protein
LATTGSPSKEQKEETKKKKQKEETKRRNKKKNSASLGVISLNAQSDASMLTKPFPFRSMHFRSSFPRELVT